MNRALQQQITYFVHKCDLKILQYDVAPNILLESQETSNCLTRSYLERTEVHMFIVKVGTVNKLGEVTFHNRKPGSTRKGPNELTHNTLSSQRPVCVISYT